MNRESLERTWETGETWFYSRSRQELWHKGATSGHAQKVRGISFDCDQDAILVKVEQIGAACHEGYTSCFFREINPQGELQAVGEPVFDPKTVYNLDDATMKKANRGTSETTAELDTGSLDLDEIPQMPHGLFLPELLREFEMLAKDKDNNKDIKAGVEVPKSVGDKDVCLSGASIILELYQIILVRQQTRPEGSYTAYLFNKGIDKICKKVGEEAAEVIIAAKNRSREELVYESADLIYHLLVLLAEAGVNPDEVFKELVKRR